MSSNRTPEKCNYTFRPNTSFGLDADSLQQFDRAAANPGFSVNQVRSCGNTWPERKFPRSSATHAASWKIIAIGQKHGQIRKSDLATTVLIDVSQFFARESLVVGVYKRRFDINY